jgi:hypothetical protein
MEEFGTHCLRGALGGGTANAVLTFPTRTSNGGPSRARRS